MHVQERQAWYMLIVIAATLALIAILVAIVGLHPAAFGAFGLFGLAGFASLIGRRERKAGAVTMDERDRQIAQSGTIGGYSVFWLLFVAAAMGPFFILGPEATLTLRTTTICNLPVAAMLVIFAVRSLIIVVLYRKDRDA